MLCSWGNRNVVYLSLVGTINCVLVTYYKLNCVTSYHCYVLVYYYVRLTLIHFLTPVSLSTLSWGKWLTASLLFNACVCPSLNIIVLHLISSSLLVCSVCILLVVFSVSLFLLLIRVIPYNCILFFFCHFLIIVVLQHFLGYSQSISFYDKNLYRVVHKYYLNSSIN